MCSDFFSEAHVLRYTEPLGYQSDQLKSQHAVRLEVLKMNGQTKLTPDQDKYTKEHDAK